MSENELTRYARQLALPEVGLAGQQKLRSGSVLIVGVGGLGSPVALYLAAAGVGTLGLVDSDVVELSNLHRQIAHGTPDIDRSKAESAAESVHRLNPQVRTVVHSRRLDASNAAALIQPYDLVIDGSDNYATRYAVNDACAALGKPWVYGSVERFSGQLSVFGFRGGPCYRCVFPDPPAPGTTASCEEIGVLGAVPGAVGSMQAVEALKCILGIGRPLSGSLLQMDFATGAARSISIERRPDCAACGRGGGAGATVGADAVDVGNDAPESGAPVADIEPADLARLLRDSRELELVDVREPWEWKLGVIGKPMLLPLGELEQQLAALDRHRELILYCHHGSRSGLAAEWLRSLGFRARSLVGGTDRWSTEIDPTLPRY